MYDTTKCYWKEEPHSSLYFYCLVFQKLVAGDLLETTNIERTYWTQSGGRYLVLTYNNRTREKHAYPKYMLKQLPKLFNFSNFN